MGHCDDARKKTDLEVITSDAVGNTEHMEKNKRARDDAWVRCAEQRF